MEHSTKAGRALCLRLHAGYLCQHTGACCTAGWTIPIETPAYERVRVHFGERRLPLVAHDASMPEGVAAVLATTSNGACVFFEPARGNLCAVHRELGAASLPAACQHFPRIVLHDARGTLVSLSHFCPTAAGLIRSPTARGFEIIRAPRALVLEGEGGANGGAHLEGLDAREALPPLVAPGLLTDLEGYDAWERRAIGVLARANLTALQALAIVAAATRAVQAWRPGGVSLRAAVEREFDIASAGKPDENLDAPERDELRVGLALSSVPHGLPCRPMLADWLSGWHELSARRSRDFGPERWKEVDDAIRGYLAARLFGNWIAYYGLGLHAIVEYLRVALAIVKSEMVRIEGRRDEAQESPTSPWQTVSEAVRSADLLLVHLADTRMLSRRLSAAPPG